MLTFLFLLLSFSRSASSLEIVSVTIESGSLAVTCFGVVISIDVCPFSGPFILKVLRYPYPSVETGQVLSPTFMYSYRNCRQLC